MPDSSPVDDEVFEELESCRRCSVLGGDPVRPSSIESFDRRPVEVVRLYDVGIEELILLISTPRKVPGARAPMAFGMPQNASNTVANLADCTIGANIMDAAKSMSPHAHAVRRVGFFQLVALSSGSRLAGGRAV